MSDKARRTSAAGTSPSPRLCSRAVNTPTHVAALTARDDLTRRVDDAIELLESIHDDRGQLAELDEGRRIRLLRAAGLVVHPDPVAKRELVRAARRKKVRDRRATDELALERSGIREKRRAQVFTTPLPRPKEAPEQEPSARSVIEPRKCYVCKRSYRELHPFYDSLCSACGDFNEAKRAQSES